MTLGQFGALIEAENALLAPTAANGVDRGTGEDLMALAGMAG